MFANGCVKCWQLLFLHFLFNIDLLFCKLEFGKVSLWLDREKIGQPVLVFTHVRLEKQTTELLKVFEDAVRQLPEVQYLLHVSGGWNFILHVRDATPQAYFTFIMDHINSLGNIGCMESCFVMRECKSDGAFNL
jgi:DNA-binding Lrp family transcriptional regulator